MRFLPGEVVMVVHALQLARADQREHLADHPLAPGIGVLAGQLHGGDVVLPDGLMEAEDRGHRVHAAFRDLRVELAPAGECKEARRGAMAEAARSEVDADPQEIGKSTRLNSSHLVTSY